MKALLTTLILSLPSAAMASGLLPYKDSTRTANGARLYAQHCASCHGDERQGEPDWQIQDANGYLPAPPHDETGHTWHHPDGLLVDIVTRGTEAIVGGSYRSNMIGFGEILSEAEILDTLAFIKSTWPAEVIKMHNDINARDAAWNN